VKVSFITAIDKCGHALVLTNNLTDLSVSVNRKIKYWIAMFWVQLLFLPYQFRTYELGYYGR